MPHLAMVLVVVRVKQSVGSLLEKKLEEIKRKR
jgi:hypothetical protein